MPQTLYYDPAQFQGHPIAHLDTERLFELDWKLPTVAVPDNPDLVRIRLGGEEVPLLVILELGLERVEVDLDRREGRRVPHLHWNVTVRPSGIREVIMRLHIKDSAGPRFHIKEFLSKMSLLPAGQGARVVFFFGVCKDGKDFVQADWSAVDGLRRRLEHARKRKTDVEKRRRSVWWGNIWRFLTFRPVRPLPRQPELFTDFPEFDPWHLSELEPVISGLVREHLAPAAESLMHQMILAPEIGRQLRGRGPLIDGFAFTRLETALVHDSLASARLATRLL